MCRCAHRNTDRWRQNTVAKVEDKSSHFSAWHVIWMPVCWEKFLGIDNLEQGLATYSLWIVPEFFRNLRSNAVAYANSDGRRGCKGWKIEPVGPMKELHEDNATNLIMIPLIFHIQGEKGLNVLPVIWMITWKHLKSSPQTPPIRPQTYLS